MPESESSGGGASKQREQLSNKTNQLEDPLASDDIIKLKAKISSAKRIISQNINKTEEVARKIRTLNEKGETEVNSEFMKSEIHFGIDKQ